MITITPDAAKKIIEMIKEDNDGQVPENCGLRFYVQGGGCSGFQYGLNIEKEPDGNDKTFESNGLKIFVDPISFRYLDGSEIYIKDDGVFSGVAVRNPNTKGTCGCGQSFDA